MGNNGTHQPDRGRLILFSALIVAAAIIAGALIVVNAVNDAHRTERCASLRDSYLEFDPLTSLDDLEEAEQLGCEWAK